MRKSQTNTPGPADGTDENGKPKWEPLRLDEPVVILTCARSGSTLLRTILDSHPALACPPETGMVNLCASMGVPWMVLEGNGTGARPALSSLAAASIRTWVRTTYGAYLIAARKPRLCEKSIGAAESAGRFLTLFPKAKFICLYRNSMDVIDSLIESCPWGLTGYGVDFFASAHPGNSVAAAADFWVSKTRLITVFEEARSEICLRVRYEDLVTDPEGQSSRIFSFLGEEPVPDLVKTCLARGPQNTGPSDHKIWSTGEIHTDSVSRGRRIPVRLIPPPIIGLINALHAELGYSPVDGNWNYGSADPRAQLPPASAGPVPDGPVPDGPVPDGPVPDGGERGEGAPSRFHQFELLLADRLKRYEVKPAQCPQDVALTITATGYDDAQLRTRSRHLKIAGSGSSATEPGFETDEAAVELEVTGEVGSWIAVLSGSMNVGTALRRGNIRFTSGVDHDWDIPPALRADPRDSLLARVLGDK